MHGLTGDDKNDSTKCTEIMERVMADVHPFTVYDIYADACPADGLKGRGGAGAVAAQLSRALSGIGGGVCPAHRHMNGAHQWHKHHIWYLSQGSGQQVVCFDGRSDELP